MAIGITVQFTIQEGSNDAFEAGFAKASAVVKEQDEGCEMYDLFSSVENPVAYAIIERWASQELLDAHMKSPSMAGMAELGPHFASAPAMTTYEVD